MSTKRRPPSPKTHHRDWLRSPFALTLASGLLLYLSFPPWGLSAVVWLAPTFWLTLIRKPELTGRWLWGQIWAGSLVHWLLVLEGIRKAHWANNFGWLALAGYLAVYLPLFIWLARVAVHRLRVPLVVAAPVIWTGLELVRAHMITGFSMAQLGHALVNWIALIQISDLFGAYGVSFVVMLVCAGFLQSLAEPKPLRRYWPIAVAVLVLALTAAYGVVCLRHQTPAGARSLKVALLQGTVDKVFEFNPARNERTFRTYLALAEQARDRRPDLDLIVWPESVFTANTPELIVESDPSPPEGVPLDAAEYRRRIEMTRTDFERKVRSTAERINRIWRDGKFATLDISQIVGCETVVVGGPGTLDYNATLLIDSKGNLRDRYYKMHPVMFGEYVPFGDIFPWLYRLTPLPQGLSIGKSPSSFEIKGFRISPSVCFESSVPHLIRGHVAELGDQGVEPDLLVNVSDDGWFWGSAILDFQLAGAVFRAVELRRPFLVSANAGISALIDSRGRIVQQGRRRNDQALLADVPQDRQTSVYLRTGDLSSGLCLAACVAVALYAIAARFVTKSIYRANPTGPNVAT
jgi:apolipoprotein N-acyltransferase